MEHFDELNDNLSESDFVHAVIVAASQTFTKEEKVFLKKTRIVKLAALTADKLDFPLTRGWFRYGIYSSEANLIRSSIRC